MNRSSRLTGVSLAVLAVLGVAQPAMADQTTTVQGIHDKTPSLIAFQNANIVLEPGNTVRNATLVIENGKVRAINRNNNVPEGARVVDVSGHTIYPGFIDAYANYGMPKVEQDGPRGYRSAPPIYSNEREGGNAANAAIHAEKQWVERFAPDASAAKDFVSHGFTAVQSARLDGIFQGQSVVVSLADKIPNDLIYNAAGKHFGSFDKGSSSQQYPSSLMGSIALVRQTLADADWYESAFGKSVNGEQVEYNAALQQLTNIEDTGMVFAIDDEQSLLRADKVFDAFEVPTVFLGSGFEYARLEAVKNAGSDIILPLNFPAAPEVQGVNGHLDVSLADLRHWERAPGNAAALSAAGVDFAFTLAQLEKKDDFWPNLRKAVQHGLDKDTALAALTTIPAKITGISSKAGRLSEGYMADFVIAKGDLFDDGEIVSVWLQGDAVELQPLHPAQFSGTYTLSMANQDLALEVATEGRVKGSVTVADNKQSLRHGEATEDTLSFVFDAEIADLDGSWRVQLTQTAEDTLTGVAVAPDGRELAVTGQRQASESQDEEQAETAQTTEYVSQLTYPNMAFGLSDLPARQNLHIKNATVWTADEAGTLENADIIIRNGEFERIGEDLSTPSGYTVIDAEGKHVTPGIIDEHSHIAISQGVNEGSEAITAEVAIGDVVNPDDIHIYRSLAGGTTMAQLLHGSANPAGGQAQVIKLRWGADADLMKFDAAPASIKFALGENVKQSNWGSDYTIRYPQSRMGVQTILKDGFQAALDYKRQLADYESLSRSERQRQAPPRPDYRLKAMLEILEGERFVHAHSYVQSEILMLLRLAEEFDFTLTTFTHILEGYKVATEMAKHGAGASTFADWWGFKFEVYDAIPQNACLMAQKGVLTSINSDSNDLQRRLNTEAAKSVRYCGMSEEDALQMVTLNPAKQLKVDQYVGSIKEGKHADFVIWNDHPLSAYARVEQTWINARKYFDRNADLNARADLETEKQLLIQKVLDAGDSAQNGAANGYKKQQPTWHCEDQHDVWLDEFMTHTHGGRH